MAAGDIQVSSWLRGMWTLAVYARCRRAFAIRVRALYRGLIVLRRPRRTITSRPLGCWFNSFSARKCRWSCARERGVLARRDLSVDGGGESGGGRSSSNCGRHAVCEQPRSLWQRRCGYAVVGVRCAAAAARSAGPAAVWIPEYQAGLAEQ